jgi:hypothetical protein
MKPRSAHNKTANVDLDDFLHPARPFRRPKEVVGDIDLTLSEKRAILGSWASDGCAIEAAPALRSVPGAGRPVTIDEILEALRTLDKEAIALAAPPSRVARGQRRQSLEEFRIRRKLGQVDGRPPH